MAEPDISVTFGDTGETKQADTKRAFDDVIKYMNGYVNDVSITANQNNYDPGDCTVLRVTSDASRDITGIAAGGQGRFLVVIETSGNGVVLKHQDANSDAANRIITKGSLDNQADERNPAVLWYDVITARWRVVCGTQVVP